MKELKNSGVIQYIGLSKAKAFDYETHVDVNEFDVIQEDVNLLYLEPLKKPKPKVTYMARSPLASGLLSGKITTKTEFSSDDNRSSWLIGERLKSLTTRIKILKQNFDLNLSDLATQFLIQHNSVDKIIFGVKSRSHVDSILKNISASKLDSKFNDKLMQLYDDDYGLQNERHLGY